MGTWKDNIAFLLIEPKEPGNIGASARAMKNMGFTNLELIKPADHLAAMARQMACQSIDVLEKAKLYSNLRDALKDKNLIIGTTRRLGRTRGLIIPLKDSIKRIIKASEKNKIALLFGREKNGLTNQEVEKCGFLITIPSDPLSPSLNLAQGVLLVAYELSQKTYTTTLPALLTQRDLEKLYNHIQSTLRLLDYMPRGDSDLEQNIMKNLKHFIGRAGLTEWELKMLYGICSQVRKRIK